MLSYNGDHMTMLRLFQVTFLSCHDKETFDVTTSTGGRSLAPNPEGVKSGLMHAIEEIR